MAVISSPSGVMAVMVTFPLSPPTSMSFCVIVMVCVQVKTESAGQNEASSTGTVKKASASAELVGKRGKWLAEGILH